MKQIVGIIGGGASGLIAAISAARNGAKVLIFEKSNRVGKKILATGNGRCNYSNTSASSKDFHGKNTKIIDTVFDTYGVNDTLNFFEDIGIYPLIKEDGKVYPRSLQASCVLNNLRYEIEKLKIEEITDCNVKKLRKMKDGFDIITADKNYFVNKVIICTGGMAGSQYGCNGDGYRLAESFGHEIVRTFPALVQLKLEGDYLKRIAGVKFDGVASVIHNNSILREEVGEILFTDYGVSGPPILQLSRLALSQYYKNEKIYLNLDMFPELNLNMLYDILHERFEKLKGKTVEESFEGMINKKLIPVILNAASTFYKDVTCENFNKKEIYAIANILKNWKFEIIGHNNWQQAQTTAGGISTKEVNPLTLESKKVENLFFAGEVLDIDGDCGGFNLQWAWSSGYIAGLNASKN